MSNIDWVDYLLMVVAGAQLMYFGMAFKAWKIANKGRDAILDIPGVWWPMVEVCSKERTYRGDFLLVLLAVVIAAWLGRVGGLLNVIFLLGNTLMAHLCMTAIHEQAPTLVEIAELKGVNASDEEVQQIMREHLTES